MYKVRAENKKTFRFQNLGLYESCLKVVGVEGGVVGDSRGLIVFWCSYHTVVKAGYGANEYERQAIKNWILI